ncbi:MAG: translocation/assembly module TamB domain-containing protein [Candidatus Krumholzibacteriia bacterium]
MNGGRGSGRLKSLGGRLLRLARAVVLILLGLLAVVVLGLALAPVRGKLLGLALTAADGALPGDLTVAEHAWPRPGTIELEDVLWVHGSPDAAPDTLIHVRRLVAEVDLGALLDRDLVAESLEAEVTRLDLPALVALFSAAAAADTAVAAADDGTWSGSFPRAGSLGGAPSVAVGSLDVSLESATLAPALMARGLSLRAAVDLRAARTPALELRVGPASLRQEGGGPAGAEPLVLELTQLALDAGWDEGRRQVRVDSLDAVIAAVGSPGLAGRWRGQAPLTLVGSGWVGLDGDAVAAVLAAQVTAPGTPLLGDGWPAAAADFTGLTADLTLEGRADADTVQLSADLELAARPGPGRLRLAAAASFAPDAPADGHLRVDSLAVALPGFALAGAGSLDRGVLAATATVRAATPLPLLTAFVPAAAAADAVADLDLALGGTLADPRVRLDLQARADLESAAVPHLTLRAEGNRRDLRLRLAADGAVVGDSLAFADTLIVTLRLRPAGAGDLLGDGPVAADLDGRFGGARRATRGRVVARAVVDPARPAAATVAVDTFDLAAPGLRVRGSGRRDTTALDLAAELTLRAPSPLLETLVPDLADGTYAADLDLVAAGSVADPSFTVDGSASCDVPRLRVPSLTLHAAGDRRDLSATVRAAGGLFADGRALADSLLLDVAYAATAADGLPLTAGLVVERGTVRAGMLVAAGADSVFTIRLDTLGFVVGGQRLGLQAPATVRLDTVARRIDVSTLALAGDPGTFELAGTLSPDSTRVDAVLDLLLPEALLSAFAPTGPWDERGGFDLGAAGTVALELGPEATRFDGGLRVRMHPHRDEPTLGAELAFQLVEGDSAGLTARFTATAADTALLRGTARLAGHYDTQTNRWVADAGHRLALRVPEQTVPMGLLTRLLPAGTGIRGDLTLAADASLPLVAPAGADTTGASRIAGTVRSRRLNLDLPNNSRLELRVDGKLSGSLDDPRVGGKVRVLSGFLRIPELPRNLHPAEGAPALWALTPADSAGADSLGLEAWGPADDRPAPPAPFLPDLDLTVEVPGNLILRGYGLDVEVAADVTVGRGFDVRGRPGPALHGNARAVRGTLRFMNRNFEIQQADVRFTGAVPADPELDLTLQAAVAGTMIRLLVTGRASAPVIELDSDPDLDRADIVAVLLFGQPLNNLDAEQRGQTRQEEDPARQFRENLAGLALALGTGDLQDSVSGALGVDIVEVGSDASGGSTLTAGKYLGPRVLLKYNASLEKSGTYFVTLEYRLTELFRIVSTYGQGEEASGLELKWLRRY